MRVETRPDASIISKASPTLAEVERVPRKSKWGRRRSSNPTQATPVAANDTLRLDLTVELRRGRFQLTWLFIVAIHTTCAVHLTLLARVYRFLAHPYMVYYSTLVLGEQYPLLKPASAVYFLLGALHWWQLFVTLGASVRVKELVFASGTTSAATRAVSALSSRVLSATLAHSPAARTATCRCCFHALTTVQRQVTRLWNLVFGIESPVFHLVFTLREVVEIVSQTVQAKRSSELLSRPWLNSLFVALVVANCWSTPAVQSLCRRHEGVARIFCLLLDVLLNMGSSMLVPAAVFLPYYRALSPVTFKFAPTTYFNLPWFTRMVMENRLIFSLAPLGMVAKLVPHVGIFVSLTSVVELLQRQRRVDSGVASSSIAVVPAPPALDPLTRAGPAVHSLPQPKTKTKQKREHWRHHVVHGFFFVWGLVLLCVHVHASSSSRFQQPVPGCLLATRPWFTSGYPCSVYVHNCVHDGSGSPTERSWALLDPDTLMFLSIAHCDALRVPHRLQSFANLLGFHLYNATLLEWTTANAISADRHRELRVLVIMRTNLTRLPDGMLEPLPARLTGVRIAYSNLSTLPSDLHTRWGRVTSVVIEHTLLAQFPQTLLSLGLQDLSLHGNRLETLPELQHAHQHFLSLVVSANPLRELPSTLGAGTSFSFFSAEQTMLTALPTWVRTSVQDTVFLHETPFCDARGGGDSGGGDRPPVVACDKRDSGKFPVAFYDTVYAI